MRWLWLVFCLWLLAATPAMAQVTITADGPVLLESEEIEYDTDGKIVRAIGAVFLSRGPYTLLADKVTYDQTADKVLAEGRVVLVDDSGDTYYADRMELTDELKNGFIESVSVRMADNSLIVAKRGDREDGNRSVFRDVVYTPCEVCPDSSPTWELSADTVVHDQENQTLTYSDAFLEILGTPILYTPYLQHPDPTVRRQSGFLPPAFGVRDTLGFSVAAPYYWAQAENRDITFTPIVYTQTNPLLAIDLRDVQPFGTTVLNVNGTYSDVLLNPGTDNQEVVATRGRGSIEGEGRYNLTQEWGGGFDIDLTTDPGFLRQYGFSNDNVLENRLFGDRFTESNFIDISGFAFQGLRPTDDQGQIPYVLPRIRSQYDGDLGFANAKWSVIPDVAGLFRTAGVDSNRASLGAGVEVPFVSPFGDVFTAGASVRGDLYAIVGDAETDVDDGVVRWRARATPRFTLDWRRPYSRAATQVDGWTYLIEPQASFTIATNEANDPIIPDEDSSDGEFDETNLFSPVRFPGYDLIDGGSKVAYGIRSAADNGTRELWSVFVGQSFAFSENPMITDISGLEEDLSDLVGRIDINPHPWVTANYRFRFDTDFERIPKSDVTAAVGPPRARVGLKYLRLEDEDPVDGLTSREEITAAISLGITDEWSLIASTRRDLDIGRTITDTFGVVYDDGCLRVVAGLQRDNTQNENTPASTTIAFQVGFRNLGEFGGDTEVGGGGT